MSAECAANPCVGCPIRFLPPDFWQEGAEAVNAVMWEHSGELKIKEELLQKFVPEWVRTSESVELLNRRASLQRCYQVKALISATIQKKVSDQCISPQNI